MASLLSSLAVGVSGLNVSQNALNTTSHNLANVDSDGYVRQQTLIKNVPYTLIGYSANSYMQVGLGAATETVRQVRDRFLDQRYRQEVGRLGFYDSQRETVREIEDIFGELEGVKFQDSLEDIWKGCSELLKDPLDLTARTNFVKKVQAFLERSQTMSEQVNVYQVKLNQQISDKVDRINELGKGIYAMNEKIRSIEGGGVERANDYRDERNRYLDELGQLLDITYSEDIDGVVSVMAEGVPFVTPDLVTVMSVETYKPNYEKVSIISEEIAKLNAQIQTAPPASLQALLDKRQEHLDELRKYAQYTLNPPNDTAGNLKVVTGSGDLVDGANYNDKVAVDHCSTSKMVKPIWRDFGADVFRFDTPPSTANNTNIGSLKGLVYIRGTAQANYSNIPLRDDFTSDKAYENAVEEYNKQIDSSMIMKVQAEFDQLIHGLVTGINDILSPNKEIELPNGTRIKILDEENAPLGMDEDGTMGTELFVRKGVPRYTEQTLTYHPLDEDGNKIQVAPGPPPTYLTETKTVRVYTEEDPTIPYTLYTIDGMEINPELLKNYSKLPLSVNSVTNEENNEVVQKLADLWNTKFSSLNPNNELAKYTFKEYYTAMIGEVANRGNTIEQIAEDQEKLVLDFDTKRQNITAVSSDEELTNLIKFQHAYNASSRYINVISEMLEHIINRM